ncbi:MAG: hypothetical protein IPO70_04420 [Bacteroidetes bacterium]|nr:hypothetical protein [Bacteroidota bacterium]
MKKILLIFTSFILTSCAVTTTAYYQVYKTTPENAILNNKVVAFEDKNCSVVYDLWKDGGDAGFLIKNKTDKDIIVDLGKTFFTINGISRDYYKNQPQIIIPGKMATPISEYSISQKRYSECNLNRMPDNSSTDNKRTFTKENSPFIFSNIITYSIDGVTTRMENNFYVNEIANYSDGVMFFTADTNKCGGHYSVPVKYFKNPSASSFYFKY